MTPKPNRASCAWWRKSIFKDTIIEVRIYSDRQAAQPLIVWLEALKDLRAKAHIQARMVRVAAGNFGDCKPLRDGVQELRIDYGPG